MSVSLEWMNLTALFRTLCSFLFCVREAMHVGILGYPSTGINRDFTKVVLNLGVKLTHPFF